MRGNNARAWLARALAHNQHCPAPVIHSPSHPSVPHLATMTLPPSLPCLRWTRLPRRPWWRRCSRACRAPSSSTLTLSQKCSTSTSGERRRVMYDGTRACRPFHSTVSMQCLHLLSSVALSMSHLYIHSLHPYVLTCMPRPHLHSPPPPPSTGAPRPSPPPWTATHATST